jgi:hypothetical protein
MKAACFASILLLLGACTADYGPNRPGSEPPVPISNCDPDIEDCQILEPFCQDPDEFECDRL